MKLFETLVVQLNDMLGDNLPKDYIAELVVKIMSDKVIN